MEIAKGGGQWGVLLLAHGAPDRLEDIPAFLLNVRGGRKLPDAAVNEIVRRYSLIRGSPLLRLTILQAEALAKFLGRPVYVGMRNWKPFICKALRQIEADGIKRVVALCLAPQTSCTSAGLLEAFIRRGSAARARFAGGVHRELARSSLACGGISRESRGGASPRAS